MEHKAEQSRYKYNTQHNKKNITYNLVVKEI
jgi:hypothetical protein